jgi:hypothetical protein
MNPILLSVCRACRTTQATQTDSPCILQTSVVSQKYLVISSADLARIDHPEGAGNLREHVGFALTGDVCPRLGVCVTCGLRLVLLTD